MSRLLPLVLALIAMQVMAAPAAVHVRGADGKWVKLSAAQTAGSVTLKLGVDQIGGGRVNVVVNKPEWMVLEDAQAPKLAWVKLNGQDVRLGQVAELGAISQFPATISFGIKDDLNPLNRSSVRFSLGQQREGIAVDSTEVGPPKTSGRVSVSLPKLPAGLYHGVLEVADAGPDANQLRVQVAFSVMGISVAEDLQTINLAGSGGSFVFKASGQQTLQTGNGPSAYLTSNTQGQHMYLEKIVEVQTLADTPELKSVRVIGLPGQTDKNQDGTKLCRLEYDLSIRSDLPCLLVTSRTVNLGPKGGLYCWWGWLPGAKYVDSRGEHEWSAAYTDVGKVGWVFLPSGKPEVNGIGWISRLVFGESRFSTMLLYTDPQTIPDVEIGAAVEVSFALMPAESADEVEKVAAKLKTLLGW